MPRQPPGAGKTKITVTPHPRHGYVLFQKRGFLPAPTSCTATWPGAGWQALTLAEGVADEVVPNAVTDTKQTVVRVTANGTVDAIAKGQPDAQGVMYTIRVTLPVTGTGGLRLRRVWRLPTTPHSPKSSKAKGYVVTDGDAVGNPQRAGGTPGKSQGKKGGERPCT